MTLSLEHEKVALGLEKTKELPIALQRFAGVETSKPYTGWVEMEEPVKILNGEVEFW